jgi:hypothetical protein
MPSSSHEFSDDTLRKLLRALRARAATHPESPGLVASWPAVNADRMAAACGELRGRGHAISRVLIPSASVPGRWHIGWSAGAAEEESHVAPGSAVRSVRRHDQHEFS